MLWLAMTPDTRGAIALSASGEPQPHLPPVRTYLFEARPWILHSIRHKGLSLFQINLPIGDVNSPLTGYFRCCVSWLFSLLSFHNLQKNTHQHTKSQHGSYCLNCRGLGLELAQAAFSAAES